MGRNAKLRKQRQQSALSEVSSVSQKPSQLSSQASSLSKKSSPKQQSENTSFWAKIAASLNPFPKVDKYQACIDAQDFAAENQFLMGAVAWSGYQQQGKGLVLVQDLDSSPPEIEYIPRKFLKKIMRQHGVDPENTQAMDNMIEVYEPTNSVVMVYVNNNSEMSAFMTPQTEPTPEECYRRMQETT